MKSGFRGPGWATATFLALATHSGAATLTVGTNINATRLAGNQTETTIAVNPTNALNLFVAVNNGTFPTPGLFRYTTNGGLTWSNSDVSTLPAACCDARERRSCREASVPATHRARSDHREHCGFVL